MILSQESVSEQMRPPSYEVDLMGYCMVEHSISKCIVRRLKAQSSSMFTAMMHFVYSLMCIFFWLSCGLPSSAAAIAARGREQHQKLL